MLYRVVYRVLYQVVYRLVYRNICITIEPKDQPLLRTTSREANSARVGIVFPLPGIRIDICPPPKYVGASKDSGKASDVSLVVKFTVVWL